MTCFLYKSSDLRYFYAIRTPVVWHIFGAHLFANMGGGGVQNCCQCGLIQCSPFE